eukprot:3391446-Pyramimonas_sp.AAC.1
MAQAESILAARIIVLSPCPSPPFLRSFRPHLSPVSCYPSPTTCGRESIYTRKRGTIEDVEGGYPGFGTCVLHGTRAD